MKREDEELLRGKKKEWKERRNEEGAQLSQLPQSHVRVC